MVNGQCTDKTLDFRLTLEYDRTPEQSVVEWLEKLEVVRQLRRIDDVMSIIPLRLAAAPSQYTCSYRLRRGRVCERKLSTNEPLDVFLADLQRLVDLFSGVSEKAMSCAFIAGMPENVQKMLRAGSRISSKARSSPVTEQLLLMSSPWIRWTPAWAQEEQDHDRRQYPLDFNDLTPADGVADGTSHLVHSVYAARTSLSLPRVRKTRKGLRFQRQPPLPAVFNGGGTNRSYGCKRRATKRPSRHRMLVMRRPRFMMQKLEEQRRRYNYDER
ncbi:hypothetical protein T10_7478 [Trichinella papuae]|uniref:Uncharacterized protein n=1 Tax=Trichinella papuae TaxID=268474 RepID=A0A0V1M7S4_9BILA|nr:hypothetical protein T10_7478 [Trichinella papuae]